MSNIGKQSIIVPDNVKISISENNIDVKGKLGDLSISINSLIKATEENGLIMVTRSSDTRESKELHGLYRALIQNMVIGVSEGFKKRIASSWSRLYSRKKGRISFN